MTQQARYVEFNVIGRRVEASEREGTGEQDDRFLPRRVFKAQEVVRKSESVLKQWLATRLTRRLPTTHGSVDEGRRRLQTSS